MAGSEERPVAVIAAFAGNALIAVTKGVAAVMTGSGALIAETAHSIADALNQVLLYIGIERSALPPTEEHPYGYGKERYFWALVVSLFLFFGGGVFSLYEAYTRFADPHEITDPLIGFAVLAASMVFEIGSISFAFREVRREARQEGMRVRQFLRELHDPALRTVLFEDGAALAGLVFAIVGLAISTATEDHRWDAAASAAIGVLLIYVAYQLALDARGLIIGEAPPQRIRDALRATLAEREEVEGVMELLAMRMGVEQLLVTARISVRDDLNGDAIEQLLIAIRGDLQREHPEVTESYIEVNPLATAR